MNRSVNTALIFALGALLATSFAGCARCSGDEPATGEPAATPASEREAEPEAAGAAAETHAPVETPAPVTHEPPSEGHEHVEFYPTGALSIAAPAPGTDVAWADLRLQWASRQPAGTVMLVQLFAADNTERPVAAWVAPIEQNALAPTQPAGAHDATDMIGCHTDPEDRDVCPTISPAESRTAPPAGDYVVSLEVVHCSIELVGQMEDEDDNASVDAFELCVDERGPDEQGLVSARVQTEFQLLN